MQYPYYLVEDDVLWHGALGVHQTAARVDSGDRAVQERDVADPGVTGVDGQGLLEAAVHEAPEARPLAVGVHSERGYDVGPEVVLERAEGVPGRRLDGAHGLLVDVVLLAPFPPLLVCADRHPFLQADE